MMWSLPEAVVGMLALSIDVRVTVAWSACEGPFVAPVVLLLPLPLLFWPPLPA